MLPTSRRALLDRLGVASGRLRRCPGTPSRRAGRGAPRPAGRPRSPCRTRARRCGRRCSARDPCRGRSAASSCPRRRSAAAAGRAPRSRACRGPAAGSSRQSSRGRIAIARATPDELALALGQLAPASRPRSSRGRAGRAPASAAALPPRRFPTSSATSDRNDGRSAATARFSRTREVVEQLGALPGAGETEPRARRAAAARRGRVRRARRGPCSGRSPVIASMNVVLPAPFGPISPTSWPSSTSRSTLVDGVDAAEAHGQRRWREGPRVTLHRRARVRGVGPSLARACGALVERPGHALGVLDQREDQHDAAEQQEPVPGQAEPLVERVRHDALRGDQPGEDGAGDQRDAAGVGERDQARARAAR